MSLRVRLPDSRWLVGGVLALNVATLGTHAILRQRIERVGVLSRGAQLASPAGLSGDGRLVTIADYREHPCHVIRYESTRCGYCALDRSHLEALARQADLRGCSVTVLAPQPSELFADGTLSEAVALAYPSVEASRTLPFRGTPTTVVADTGWIVTWSRLGSLRETDPEEALASLD